MSPPPTIDLEALGFDEGAHLLVRRALARIPVGAHLEVRGRAAELPVHLRAWCREHGHRVEWPGRSDNRGDWNGGGPSPVVGWVIRGHADEDRWRGAERAGLPGPAVNGAVAERPPARWGLAARGALVEAGTPEFHFPLDDKDRLWSDAAARLYRQAVAAQWDPATAVTWDEPFELPHDVEAAVVQVMTYLVENENAALVVPARFLGQVHPHFREVMQVLAVQVADEARHVEVFTRRAELQGGELGLSTAGGQASLLTLLEEPDYAMAHFLLSVLGEGTFLSLLSFLERNAPDPVTRRVTHLALIDEARHVAFGVDHVAHVLAGQPEERERLATAVRRRHDALAGTTGLNEEVFDSLVLLAAGSWDPAAIAGGYAKVTGLVTEMAEGRKRRLQRLGFPGPEAAELAVLHTRNFM